MPEQHNDQRTERQCMRDYPHPPHDWQTWDPFRASGPFRCPGKSDLPPHPRDGEAIEAD